MKNIKFSRLFAAMMFVAVLSFAGCKQQPEETKASIYGTWSYENSSWNAYGDYACQISEDKIETASWGVHNGPVTLVETSDDSGFLYYQIEKNLPLYGGGEVADSAGKWSAVAYKKLTNESVLMCDIYKDPLTLANSLEEAKTLYTVENHYFDGLETSVFVRVK